MGNPDDYLDFSQFKTNISGAYSQDKKTPSKIYASITKIDNLEINGEKTNIKELAINYYFHYPYSNWKDHGEFNNHEGDWEGITVFLRKDKDGYYYPCRIAFGQHVFYANEYLTQGGEVVEWNNIQLSSVGIHPNIFVGLGGHATYSESGTTTIVNACVKLKLPQNYESISPFCKERHNGGIVYKPYIERSYLSPVSKFVEYLPRVGGGINAKELSSKE